VTAAYDEQEGELTLTFPDGSVTAGVVELGEWIETRFFSREHNAQLVKGPWSAALSDYVGQPLRLVRPERSGVDRGGDGSVSLIGRASVTRLEQIAEVGVDPRRFRMLVEIDGIDAHAEDDWVGKRVRIGEALVQMHGHVGRCLVTGQDPESGMPDMSTLDLLRSYRAGLATTEPLAFGIYGGVIEPGAVSLGDPVSGI
jgi:uncharacterized protein YcbX